MSEPTVILCEGLLKGNADLEEGPQEALRKVLSEREARLLFPQSFAQDAFAAAVHQYVNSQEVSSCPSSTRS